MKRITNVKGPRKRTYQSALRDERSEDTRQRILDGLIRTMARGISGLSVPAVAEEAGVSVPTVYRHFRTKGELVAALGPYLGEKSRLMRVPDLSNGIGALIREIYTQHGALDPDMRAAMASDLGGEVRRRMMPRRIAMIHDALATLVPHAPPDELDRLTRVVLILGATPTIRAFEEYLGRAPAEAADDVAWALETILGSLRRRRSS
jgi:AcrR family transcriptional regulator